MFRLAAAENPLPDTVQRRSLLVPMLLALLIFTTFAAFRHREMDELWGRDAVDAQVMFQAVAWLGLGLFALWLLLSGRADLRLLRGGPLFWYSCYVALAIASTAISLSPQLTAFRSLQLAVAIVLVISLRRCLDDVYRFIVIYVAINWVLVILALTGLHGGLEWIQFPGEVLGDVPDAWRFQSAFGHPSQISIVAAVGALGLLAGTRGRQWRVNGPIIVWLLLTTVLTVSRTAIAGLAGGLLIVMIARRAVLSSLLIGGAIVPLLLMSTTFHEAATRYLMRGQSRGEFASLSGRDAIFESAWKQIEDCWLTGQGFRAARKVIVAEEGPGQGVTHSHNLFLESIFGMGIAGAVLAAAVLVSLLTSALTLLGRGGWREGQADPRVGWEFLAILVPLIAFSMMDASFADGINPVVLTLIATMARLKQASLVPAIAAERAVGPATPPMRGMPSAVVGIPRSGKRPS